MRLIDDDTKLPMTRHNLECDRLGWTWLFVGIPIDRFLARNHAKKVLTSVNGGYGAWKIKLELRRDEISR